jgi:hypothetical protein
MDISRRITLLVLVGGASAFFISLAAWPLWWFERFDFWTHHIERFKLRSRSTLVSRGLWLFSGLLLAVIGTEFAIRG